MGHADIGGKEIMKENSEGTNSEGTQTSPPSKLDHRTLSSRRSGGDSAHENEDSDSRSRRVVAEPLAPIDPIEFNALVAHKAYELFEARGRQEGRGVEDWLEAERFVKAQRKQ